MVKKLAKTHKSPREAEDALVKETRCENVPTRDGTTSTDLGQ